MKALGPSPLAIFAARAATDLTQTQAGALVGAAKRTWQDWEAGITPMPLASYELFVLHTTSPTVRRLRRKIARDLKASS